MVTYDLVNLNSQNTWLDFNLLKYADVILEKQTERKVSMTERTFVLSACTITLFEDVSLKSIKKHEIIV